MSKNYTVKENETLPKIARDNGFKSYETLIDANMDDWPYLFMHPNVLVAGMVIKIPDKKQKWIQQHSGTEVLYTVKKTVKEYLKLKIEDYYGEIESVLDDIQLLINGSSIPIKDMTNYDTDPVEYKIIATANPLPDQKISNASIKLNLKSPLSGNKSQKEIKLEIGGLDPFLEPASRFNSKASNHDSIRKGAQKILTNLGYYKGELDADLEKPESTVALSRFQTEFMDMSPADDDYGKPSINTCICLGIQQGIILGPIQPIK